MSLKSASVCVATTTLLLLVAISGCSAVHGRIAASSGSGGKTTATTYYVFQQLHNHTKVALGTDPTDPPSWMAHPIVIAATVSYTDSMTATGWDVLSVTTHSTAASVGSSGDSEYYIPAVNQAFAAGFGEGYTARSSVRFYFENVFGTLDFTAPAKLTKWLNENDAFMASKIADNPYDEYWVNVNLMLEQEKGILAGLNEDLPTNTTNTTFTAAMVRLLQTQGDQMDLFNALNITLPQDTEKEDKKDHQPTPPFVKWFQEGHTHCSGLISLAPDNGDLFMGHATWGMYAMMFRVFKTYNFSYSGSASSSVVTFSSYPAVLVSIDDYYTTGAGLVVAETSFNTFNMALYKAVNPKTVLYWLRTAVANRQTTNGVDWTEMFGRYNSGTYNAQWMVLDMKLFTPFKDLKRNTFWISEQFPGLYSRSEQTMTLATGHLWGSFNLPYNRTMFDLSGSAAIAKQAGGQTMGSEQLNVRSRIWRRDWYNVSLSGLAAFQYEMQYNHYKEDPISAGVPTSAIAARGDLTMPAAQASCWGAIDAKVTSYSLYAAKKKKSISTSSSSTSSSSVAPPSIVYNGPTPQPGVFQWSKTTAAGCPRAPPAGMPDIYNYQWETMH